MSTRVQRTLTIVDTNEAPSRPVDYWRNRPLTERLNATLALHREGNELLRGGNPPFVFTLEIAHVERAR
ncbi:MAG TPA: hypothetical protein PLB00_08635 [Pseudomonadota bacterium]|jgi:hypothetical protein|nr:hypothetical protein [Pseudomonadota bacterium]